MTIIPAAAITAVQEKIKALELWVAAYEEASILVEAKEAELDDLKAFLRRASIHNSTREG